ncbi:MAG: DUF3298 and DUF4163 domain-containing protein [Bacteroidales bacterium]|nr:DUF3298 and DUF4163 domain-containing protein [Bacteroidales bacterium]
MQKHISLIILAVLTVFAVSCNNSKKADKQSETLVFDRVVFDTTAYYSKNAEGPKCSISIKMDYAKGPNAHLINDSILKSGIFLDEELKRGEKKTVPRAIDIVVKNHIKNFKKDVKELEKDGGDLEAMKECYFGVETKVAYGRDSIINYTARYDSYLGGAHGWYNSYALNFDPRTGKMIKLGDFVAEGAQDKVCELIVAKICKDFNCQTEDDLRDNEGIFGVFDPYVPENFVIGKDSVTFFYQCEEVGPYAVGEIVTKFSYAELEGLIK